MYRDVANHVEYSKLEAILTVFGLFAKTTLLLKLLKNMSQIANSLLTI